MQGTIEPIPHDAAERDYIEGFNEDGTLHTRNFGMTEAEKKEAHVQGCCTCFCGYCYVEACDWLAANLSPKFSLI